MNFLCLDFINSQWYNTHKTFAEPLENTTWLKDFYTQWALPDISRDKESVKKLLPLRTFLHTVLSNHVEQNFISQGQIDQLNTYLSTVPVCNRLQKGTSGLHMSIVAECTDITWITFKITTSFTKLITDYPYARLKKCSNPDCGWFFL